MSDQRDNMNLLPDTERQSGEAALKRAAAAKQSGEIKLVVPSMEAKKNGAEKKKSFWRRRRESKEQARMDALRKKGETGQALPVPTPAPIVPKSVEKKVKMSAPESKPLPKPVSLIAPMKQKEKMQKQVVKPVSLPVMPIEKKTESRTKLHEPVDAADLSGPRVNLVPTGFSEQSQEKPWVLYASILVLTCAVWILFSGVAIARAKRAESRVSEWNAKILQINTAIRNYEDGKAAALALQKQFTLVKQQIEDHVYWTPVLQKLEETTIPDVYYVSISANRSGEVHLRAIAKSYEAAARQIRAFERSSGFVKDVQVNQASQQLQPGSTLPVPIVAFDIRLTLQSGTLTLQAPEENPEPNQP
jgi:hypothetical protein